LKSGEKTVIVVLPARTLAELRSSLTRMRLRTAARGWRFFLLFTSDAVRFHDEPAETASADCQDRKA
jgi:hypothetical protein